MMEDELKGQEEKQNEVEEKQEQTPINQENSEKEAIRRKLWEAYFYRMNGSKHPGK